MEIYELRYFLGVARFENVRKASERLNVSPGSLSKAVSRLESELGVSLFARERRNIRLTEHGRLLQKRATEIVQLEESAKHEVAGSSGAVNVAIGGPEILLAKFGMELCGRIKTAHPGARFEFLAVGDEDALSKVERGEAHLAIVSADLKNAELSAKSICDVTFQTYVGAKHPLHRFAKEGKAARIEDVLEHAFASPDHSLLGKVGAKQSLDGWRDDRFPRRIEFLTSSLKILEELVVCGRAIAYLPRYFCESLAVKELKISGCPYECTQKIKLVARRPQQTSWLNRIF